MGQKVIRHERAETTYAFRSLIDAGTKMAFGSDWFVAPASPFLGIYAAVMQGLHHYLHYTDLVTGR
jgi:predicted amidohydrolase YtcJ